jgi:periplasmic protein TonB
MNRLQKKCFMASAGVHLLLAMILLIGPAFLSSKDRPVPSEYIDVIPWKTIEANFSRIATPNPKQPTPSPSPPAQPAAQPPAPPPPAPKEKVQEVKPDDATDPLVPQKRPKVQLNARIVTRKSDSKAKQPSESKSQERAEAAKRAAQVQSVLQNLNEGLSSSTSINVGGPKGEAYAGYEIVLQSIYKMHYDRALAAAGDIADAHASVEVSVIIDRNGNVVSARVTRPSGNSMLDRVVRRVLDEVTFIRPFPEGAKDAQRTFSIVFDLKNKRAIG